MKLQGESWATGLCPRCLLELAVSGEEEPASEAPTVAQETGTSDAPTTQFSTAGLRPGEVRGDRYQVRALLGRGGMGEVWRAYDLKLRVDVALKSLRPNLVETSAALEALRQEVRTAREVISPNVCRIFDLVEVDGRELISMEYIDGINLANILELRAPLDLAEARDIAAQFLAGLDAIHEAGLVHRDLKPENIMMTRSGRVVVMDFGIAKSMSEGRDAGVAGTPAYMPPEQRHGARVDTRADVFAAGVVLAEMIAPDGIGNFEARQAVWRAVHEDPEALPESPWRSVIGKATAAQAEDRYASASALIRAIEEVALRVEGAEDVHPYPGLSAFTRDDAAYFFGRELEVEEMWKKLQRPHLLGVIGPSGAGKSSFLRAGLLPVMPTGWRAIVATPGSRPFLALGRALEDGAETVGEDPQSVLRAFTRWRQKHEEALLIVDQFEELFTQNPVDVQGRFAEWLGCLAIESDVHVLLSMRDDFFFHCHAFEALRPMLSEVTLLGPPTGAALRRAVVQPALKCGYRFEDEAIVEEMVAEVGSERGALPMLAFAAARLWELRDRERGLLTREAYEYIGGVGGALAQHAEATLESIGPERSPIVRDLFRNLVTAQGTRVARERRELLSVFAAHPSDQAEGGRWPSGERGAWSGEAAKPEGAAPSPGRSASAAEGVLDALIDARLLTSYEVPAAGRDEGPQQQIEVVHESLLSNWPRLVRWRTQDVETVQMREQLRQAAQTWHDRHRSEDLLWTGTAFKEFELWRDRYEGGLTATEQEFVRAMTANAEKRARQRRRLLASAFVVLLVTVGALATLWWQGELARREAVAEARRAEASKLLALGRLELAEDPTAALAYATASLELDDEATTRRFLLEALWTSPMVYQLSDAFTWGLQFSPEGNWLAVGGRDERLELWARDSGERRKLPGLRSIPLGFSLDSTLLVTRQNRKEHSLRTWSVADGRLLHTQPMDGLGAWEPYFIAPQEWVLTLEILPGWQEVVWRSRPLLEGEYEVLGREPAFTWSWACLDPLGRWLAYFKGQEVRATPVATLSVSQAVLVGRHTATVAGCAIDGARQEILTIDELGTVHVWNLEAPSERPLETFELGTAIGADTRGMIVSPDARYRVVGASDGAIRLWDRSGPPDAEPRLLRRAGTSFFLGTAIDSGSEWLAVAEDQGTLLWPLLPDRSYRLEGHAAAVTDLEFSAEGDWLLTASIDRTLRRWPLSRAVASDGEMLHTQKMMVERLKIDPTGSQLAFMTSGVGPLVVPSEGGEELFLDGLYENPQALAWDVGGRWIAAGGGGSLPEEAVIKLWDLQGTPTRDIVEAGETYTVMPSVSTLDAQDGKAIKDLQFLADGDLLSAGLAGLRRWSVAGAEFEQLLDDPAGRLALSSDEKILAVGLGSGGLLGSGSVRLLDLTTGAIRKVPSHGDLCIDLALDPSGQILVTGDEQGVVRVGRIDGSEPQLLLGHTGPVQAVAVSPDGRWIASAGSDTTIRLWPMPDLSRPPLHTLAREELLTTLHRLTNLRAVEDTESDTGWSIEIGPFPGWAEVPGW